MTTDTSERGLERLICTALTGLPCDPSRDNTLTEIPPTQKQVNFEELGKTAVPYGGVGWMCSSPHDYDREYCIDLEQLSTFLRATQPESAGSLSLDEDGPTQRKFLARLEGEISKRGIIDILRKGIKHGAHHLDLFYGTPSPGNEQALARYQLNRFSVTRQLRYSRANTQNALDLGLFINGLPVFTFELKNNLTKQTVEDAVQQYRRDRDPNEKLFKFGRCMAHFAVDEQEIKFCTHLKGKASWFLPFNKGWNDSAGNPPNPNGLKIDYLWKQILARESLTNIIENYAQVVVFKDEKTGQKKKTQIWPRYHQLDVVRKLLDDADTKGAGQRYLIQHSAGSGKSNSIAWLSHQIIELEKNGTSIFDSIIVVTDRIVLDKQIRDTIRQYAQVGSTVGHANTSGDLGRFIEQGKKIIISTVQKFPFILDEISDTHHGRNFAIIIDEAHSGQGGRTSAALAQALSEAGEVDDDETVEDRINRLIESKKLLPNASYFAFTATPKNKTLEIFGIPQPQPDGAVRRLPFHSYTMKQAIQEGFILDVLLHYTPVSSYYRLVKKIEDDPMFDSRRAQKKLRRYVEGHEHAIRLKAEIMVDHFHDQVLAPGKIGGKARAMLVTGSIDRTIKYFHAVSDYLTERKSRYRAIIAFSGEHEYGGAKVSEASLNGFSSAKIVDRIQEDPYRILICADKFQTGYDEPLLHTMYVDKLLSGIKAVQTLSRLNRAHPQKHDVFVLDFMNEAETIKEAFADYYRTTILADETDPDKLHDLKGELDAYQVYTDAQIEEFVTLFLNNAERDKLDPILDVCVANYKADLDEDGQVEFKGKAKAFLRTYGFLSQILSYKHLEWEKLSIFLTFLVPKLPAPVEEDLSKGILEAIDMDSYRVEKQATAKIQLPDEDAEIEPTPPGGGGRPEPEPDRLSNIIINFNERFGGIEWSDEDRVRKLITEEIPVRVAADTSYQNAKENSDRQNARIECDNALSRVITGLLQVDTELFKEFMDNDSFRNWVQNTVFDLTYTNDKAA